MIVITGAAGMIGSCTVRHLNDLGISDLLLVDDLKRGDKWKNLVGKQFIDLISRDKLLPFLQTAKKDIAAIVHLGACSDTTETDADYLFENNVRFSIKLAEFALTENIRFLYASSAATYGDGKEGFSDDEKELYRLKPINMYGFSKHLVDLWMHRNKVFDRVVGLKYFNVFGPNEYHKKHMASFILKAAPIAKETGHLSLFKSNDPTRFADGEQCRDFIYVKDAVRMTCAFLRPEYRHVGGLYNIGQGLPTTWNQMAQFLFDALEKPTLISYREIPKEIVGYQNYTCANMDKFHRIFSMPQTPLKDAVRDYVTTYLLTQDRW
jgi:ADP-L-glycero-D-manno-heptose 6-epimerase